MTGSIRRNRKCPPILFGAILKLTRKIFLQRCNSCCCLLWKKSPYPSVNPQQDRIFPTYPCSSWSTKIYNEVILCAELQQFCRENWNIRFYVLLMICWIRKIYNEVFHCAELQHFCRENWNIRCYVLLMICWIRKKNISEKMFQLFFRILLSSRSRTVVCIVEEQNMDQLKKVEMQNRV